MSADINRRVVAVVLFDGVEVLDFAGPYEVLQGAQDEGGQSCLKVITTAARPEVRCNGGLRVLVDYTLDNCPPIDAIVVPGGPGADYPTPEQEILIPFLRLRSDQVQVTASVCTGAFILGRTGILDGRPATTHSKLLDMFRAEFPQVKTTKAKIVDEGDVITAAGVSSGIDLALYLLDKWFGPTVRSRSARDLDGAWN